MSLKIDRVQLEIVINNDQARKSLRALDDEARLLTKEMKKLKEGTEEYAQKAARLKAIKVQQDAIYESIGITNMTMKELTRRQSELNSILMHMRPGTEEYKKLKAEVTAISGRIGELKGKAQQTGFSMKGLAGSFNHYFGLVTAFAASFTGIIIGFKKAVDMANEYGKSVANLSALTGLAGKELKWLSDQAKEVAKNGTDAGIKTTAGAQEIVDAYTKVGSARPELLKNKEALNQVTQEAMILAAAANSELQPAVDALAGVLNQFNAPASDSRRIINAIAAGSKEGAGEIPYLTEAIEKSGTIAADAGISIESLVGIIETLAPRMAAPEMAGRNLRAIILKLQEGADETNPAIVGFSKAIENLANQNLSAAKLTQLFGLENVTAAKILINNREETEKYIKAVTGTNTALEQAAINTNTDAAAKQRAINNYELAAIKLGERLSPAVTVSTNAFSYLLKAMVGVIDIFGKTSTSAEEASSAFDKQVSLVSDLNQNIVPLLSRYDELAKKTNKSTSEHEELKSIVEQVSATIPSAITQFDEYGNAISISTSRVRDFIQAETDRLKVVNDAAIKENERKLKLIEQQAMKSRGRLSEIEKSGTFKVTEVTTTGVQSFTTVRNATQEEIKAEEEKYKTLIGQKRGYEAEIKRLNGDALLEESKRREAERKAAEDITNKKVDYLKKSVEELKQLSASGDELATEMLAAKPVLDNLEKQIGAHARLSKEIGDLEEKIYNLVAANKPVPNSYIHELAKKREELDQVNAVVKEIADGLSRLKAIDKAPQVDVNAPRRNKETGAQESSPFSDIMQPAGERDSGFRPDLPPESSQTEIDARNSQIGQAAISATETTQDAIFRIIRDRQQAALDDKLAKLNKQMEAELKNDKLTEAEREKLRSKYAAKERKAKQDAWRKQHSADLIQAVIKGALAVITAMSQGGLWMAIPAGIAVAAEIGVMAAQKMPQFAKGRYKVTGKDDNKTYYPELAGRPQTKIYSRPALIAEQGDELIVDSATTRNLVMNYPEIIEAIYAARVPQRATGNYPDFNEMPKQDAEMKQLLMKLNNNLEKGVRGKWYLHDLELEQEKLSLIESDSSM